MPVEAFTSTKTALRAAGLAVEEEDSELVYRGTAPVDVGDADFEALETIIERLLELDDVDSVYTNAADLNA